MNPYKLPSTGLLVTATDTPSTPQELIEAAVGSAITDYPIDLNYIFMHPKTATEDILVLFDGNNPDNGTTPTTGITVFENDMREFKGMPLNNFKIQRKTNDCQFVIQVGWTDAHGN